MNNSIVEFFQSIPALGMVGVGRPPGIVLAGAPP